MGWNLSVGIIIWQLSNLQGRRSGRIVISSLPQVQMAQYVFDNIRLFNKTDHFHGPPASGAYQGVDRIDFLDPCARLPLNCPEDMSLAMIAGMSSSAAAF
jgi:hypothetical protein